ncbi:hypothetical protein IGJ16_003038 [Enterococcus pernyi]
MYYQLEYDKGVSLMIIQICLVLNGAIHFAVIDFKEKS